MAWIKAVPPKMLHDQFGIYNGQWMPEMDRCWIETETGICVSSRLIRTDIGNVEHATITTKDMRTDLTWADKQRIKNEIFGENRCAVEVFPAENRLVDVANVYHLWIFEKGYQLPFGIHPKEYKKAINRGYSISKEELEELKKYYEK